MDEGDIDHSRYGWGAEEWVHDSQIVVEETTKRNMSVSFTSGTNWSNANLPTIDADHPAAAKELDVVSEDLARRRLPQRTPCRGSTWRPSRRPHHLPGAARRDPRAGAGRRRRRPRPGGDRDGRRPGCRLRVDLTDQVHDEALDWTAPDDGTWRLFIVLDARHRPDRIPVGVGQLHRQLRRPRRRPGGDRLLGLGGAHPRTAGADRPEPAGADVHGLPRAVDVRRRRAVLGPYGGRGVPDPPRLRHHAVAAVPDPDGAR